MSKVKIQGNASGTGVVTLTAPNTNTDRTITLPDDTQTLIGTNASGNVGIGTTTPVVALDVTSASATTAIIDSSASFSPLAVGGSSAVSGIQFKNTVSSNGYVYYDNGANMNFHTNGTEKLRLQSGGGISFNGDTAAANALDDYETGTATLTLTASTTAPTVPPTATAYYTKIGNTVTVTCKFGNKDITGAVGNVLITGFPFTTTDISLGSMLNSRGQNVSNKGYMGAGVATMTQSNYAGNALAWGSIGPSVYAFVSITYITV